MSTKTTFKRVALVAVAALGFGTLTVAPSSAVQLVSVTQAAGSTTGTTSIENRAVLSLNGYCDATGRYAVTNYISVWAELPAASRVGLPSHGALTSAETTAYSSSSTNYGPTNTSLAFTGQYQSVGKQWVPANDAKVDQANSSYVYCNTVGRYAQLVAVSFTPDVPGTYKIMTFDPTNASTQSFWTVVVTDPTVKSSTAFINASTGSAPTADSSASDLVFSAAANTTAKARLTVRQYSTTDTTTAATTAISKEVVVATSKGLISKTNDYSAAGSSVSTLAAGSTNGVSDYYLFANGTTGTATITVTVGGVLLSTKTVVFNGAAVKLSAALTTGQNSWIAPNTSATLTVSALDVAGNAASNTPTITATSSNTAVATVVATSNTLVTITGVAAGTAVITVADSATSSPASSSTYTVTVKAATTTAAATLTFDKTEYAAGELMTITISADIADKSSYVAFTALPVASANLITVKNPFTGSSPTFSGTVALVAGKATWTAYAPLTSGPLTVTATSGSDGPTTAVTVTATTTVVSDGVAQAAADAAAEATDAANAATDAANAAAEAADAATAAAQDAADAVAALSVQVNEQIEALKAQNEALRKQLIALTNLIIKIQKKVKA